MTRRRIRFRPEVEISKRCPYCGARHSHAWAAGPVVKVRAFGAELAIPTSVCGRCAHVDEPTDEPSDGEA